MSVAGRCEWCGGPAAWTVIRGEVYVSCDGGCMPLPLEGLVAPPDSPELVDPFARGDERELLRGQEVVPPEGSEARTSV